MKISEVRDKASRHYDQEPFGLRSEAFKDGFDQCLELLGVTKEIDEVLKLALQNKFIDARNKLMDVMLNYGLSGLDIIKQIQQEILSLDIENEKKMLLMEKCGEIEFRMTEGSDEFIQLEALLSQFALYGSKK